jgi:hypothetical protein
MVCCRDSKSISGDDNDALSVEYLEGKQVIPVLVGGAKMPGAEALPEPLQPLCRLQAVRIGSESFNSDTQRLVRFLQSMRDE